MKNLPRKKRNSKRSRKFNTNWETPIFERLEPRLLLNADIYGVTAGQDSIAPLDAEASIEVDLNAQANAPVEETTGAPIAQSLPYTQDFSSGKPDSAAGWEYFSDTVEGRIQVTAGQRLRMDDTTADNISTLNEAILHIDLTGKTNVTLILDHWSLSDENTPLLDSFSGHYKGDGIALSVDGINWVKVTDLTGNFTEESFALDAIIELAKVAAGSNDVSNVRIKFQQYDNYPADTDGREFDNIKVTTNTVQSLPYSQDFESGVLPSNAAGWEYFSNTTAGRIQVTAGKRLRMDTSENNVYTLNEAILHVDLTGKANIILTLDHWSLGDENTPLLDNFTGHYKGDGIALSVDGINWVKVTDLTGDFTEESFALDAIIELAKAAAGSDDVSDVRIKFQQYDNYPADSDGREFDNIKVISKIAQSVPYTQDFEAGLPELKDGWEYYSSTEDGRIQVTAGGSLRMDTSVNNVYTLNEAILHVDLTGKVNVTLTLDHTWINDEYNGMLESFTGHYKADGIALSVDGINWIRITNLDASFTDQSFALDAIIELAKAAAGSDDVSDVRIKFQQYDNYPANSDGREFDNIKVTSKIAQSVPYTQDFEAGLPELKDGWEYYSSTEDGRIQVTAGGSLRMDTTASGVYNLNEAILHVDLTGKTNVILILDHTWINDEYNGMLESFTGHYKSDGIALSVDGINWIRVTNLDASFIAESFALDSIIELAKAAAGSDDVSDVRIKFQQYDNYPATSDGREFDNIKVVSKIAQSVPYTQDFGSGLPELKDGWEYYSSTTDGRIQVTPGDRLRMDTSVNNVYTLNEAILHVDLTGKTNVKLTLDHWDLNDEDTPILSSFTGHYKGDGIALSVDGINWIKVTDLTGSFTGQSFSLDSIIDLAKAAAGSDDVSDVRIKFQQYDNYPASSDGREFDNIKITAT